MSKTEFNDYNSALFNIRARSLNNLMYWLSQIIGSWIIGLVLDSTRFRRRTRAFAGWLILLAMVFIVYIWAYEYQRWVRSCRAMLSTSQTLNPVLLRAYTRQSIPPDAQKMDIYISAYPMHVWLMILYGLLDTMWQITVFWLIGAMSNDTNKLAIYVGFCKRFKFLSFPFLLFAQLGVCVASMGNPYAEFPDPSIKSAGAAGVWRTDAVGLPCVFAFH